MGEGAGRVVGGGGGMASKQNIWHFFSTKIYQYISPHKDKIGGGGGGDGGEWGGGGGVCVASKQNIWHFCLPKYVNIFLHTNICCRCSLSAPTYIFMEKQEKYIL